MDFLNVKDLLSVTDLLAGDCHKHQNRPSWRVLLKHSVGHAHTAVDIKLRPSLISLTEAHTRNALASHVWSCRFGWRLDDSNRYDHCDFTKTNPLQQDMLN